MLVQITAFLRGVTSIHAYRMFQRGFRLASLSFLRGLGQVSIGAIRSAQSYMRGREYRGA